MQEKIKSILNNFTNELDKVTKESETLELKSKYLGKKSEIYTLMTDLKNMSDEDKRIYGKNINELKYDISELINQKLINFNNNVNLDFDITLPVNHNHGSLSPVTIVAKEVTDILRSMGFKILNGPEMESEYYNFIALNIPNTHPARDMQDTYWLDNGMLLRTHTSPNQVRAMEKYGAPLRICAPGRCFRNEDLDRSHENTFFQLEGMVIDKGISISNLVFVMKELLKNVFKKDVNVRLRPGYFPFVEPGFELDCSCVLCGGKGCPTCKGTGWIELCPCGMVHPKVLEMSNIDPNIYTGFAFGLGLTRLAMMKYKIDDIRVLNSGDIRVLSDFNIE